MKVKLNHGGPWVKSLTCGKEYEVISEELATCLNKDDFGGEFNFFKERFTIVEPPITKVNIYIEGDEVMVGGFMTEVLDYRPAAYLVRFNQNGQLYWKEEKEITELHENFIKYGGPIVLKTECNNHLSMVTKSETKDIKFSRDKVQKLPDFKGKTDEEIGDMIEAIERDYKDDCLYQIE